MFPNPYIILFEKYLGTVLDTKYEKNTTFIGAQFFMYVFEVKYSESFSSERDLMISPKERKEIYEKEKNNDLVKEKLLSDIRRYLESLVINKKQ